MQKNRVPFCSALAATFAPRTRGKAPLVWRLSALRMSKARVNFTLEHDAQLTAAVGEFPEGTPICWIRVAARVSGDERCRVKCRARWVNRLKPAALGLKVGRGRLDDGGGQALA